MKNALRQALAMAAIGFGVQVGVQLGRRVPELLARAAAKLQQLRRRRRKSKPETFVF